MKPRLRIPRALVFVLSTTTVAGAAGCEDDSVCVRCLPDPRVGDAGPDGPDAVACPECMPKDGVCPVGCIPEGYA